jgi:hypothetical protein
MAAGEKSAITRRAEISKVLAERGRCALRVHLGRDVNAGLQRLSAAIQKAIR